MTGQITTADVRDAIEARRSPQCYEQIARAIELRLRLQAGSVTGQRLARHVKTLVADGAVVVLTAPSLVRQLGAFPQHYPPRTKFYCAIGVAEEKLGADTAAALVTPPPVEEMKAASSASASVSPEPGADRASCPKPERAAKAPIAKDRACGPARPDVARQAGRKSVRHLRAVGAPSLSFLAAQPDGAASAFAPQFSSGTDAGRREVPADQLLTEVTAHIAATFSDAARKLQAQADAAVLPLNKLWHEGKFGDDADYVARRLSELYDLATSNASALATDAAAILGTTATAILAESTHA